MGSGDERRLREVVTEVTTGAGYDLEDLAVRTAGRRRVVKVVLDTDGGVTLDAAADISRAIAQRLDEAGADDPTGTLPYTLEVTSPGVGRPLTLPRHFRRARTRLVVLTTTDGRTLTGHVLGVSDDGLTLVLSGRKGISQVEVPFADVDRARVEVEFNSPPAAVLALLGVQPPPEPDDEADGLEADDAQPDDAEANGDEADDDEPDDAEANGDEADDDEPEVGVADDDLDELDTATGGVSR